MLTDRDRWTLHRSYDKKNKKKYTTVVKVTVQLNTMLTSPMITQTVERRLHKQGSTSSYNSRLYGFLECGFHIFGQTLYFCILFYFLVTT